MFPAKPVPAATGHGKIFSVQKAGRPAACPLLEYAISFGLYPPALCNEPPQSRCTQQHKRRQDIRRRLHAGIRGIRQLVESNLGQGGLHSTLRIGKKPVAGPADPVFPVAGFDSMELNLSGAHAPYFTRNIVILTDSNGVEGIGEVPGGQKITNALEAVKDLVIGTKISDYKNTLNRVRAWLDANIKDDVRGLQTFDLRTGVHVVTAIEASRPDG